MNTTHENYYMPEFLSAFLCIYNRPEVAKQQENQSIPTFNLGDNIFWESQAGGHKKTKKGTIIQVIKAGESAFNDTNKPIDQNLNKYSLKNISGGKPRDHESYIVAVPYPGGERNGMLGWIYHPLTKKLHKRTHK